MALESRESRARKTIHRKFAEDCDPVKDAHLAASAIYWSHALDGPIKAAAGRIRGLHVRALVFRDVQGRIKAPDDSIEQAGLEAFVADLRALTLARHAALWAYFIQAYRVNDAVEDELASYLPSFASSLDVGLRQMATDQFEPVPADDEALRPWAEALSLHGRFWLVGRENGTPEAKLMEALWEARPIK